MNTETKPSSRDLQELGRRLVEREVNYCVSMLVDHFIRHPEAFEGSDYQAEEFYPPPDYQSACENEDVTTTEQEDGSWTWKKDDDEGEGFDTEAEAQRDACEELRLDPDPSEIYEWWIVSDWLARKLSARGEFTVDDFFGLTLWGRGCTGQAIYLDNVIEEIALEIERSNR